MRVTRQQLCKPGVDELEPAVARPAPESPIEGGSGHLNERASVDQRA